MRKHSDPGVYRITGTAAGLTEDVRGRQRRYIISMSVRTLSFILAVALWHVWTPLAWVALAAGLVLPYIAVVLANAGRENARNLPSSHLPPVVRPALGPGRERLPAEAETEADGGRSSGRG